MTTQVRFQMFFTASYPAYECCLCTISDAHGMVKERPLYSQVQVCLDCGHTVCPSHYMKCDRCYACCIEVCSERHTVKISE